MSAIGPGPVDTEKVFAALFALATPLQTSTTTPYKIMSRRFKQWSQTNSGDWPAFYQFQVPQPMDGGVRGLLRQTLKAWWFVYLDPSENDDDIVSTRLNQYRDALINVILPKLPGGLQTLGIRGIANVYVDGTLLIDEGLLEAPALIRIPITIKTGI